MNKKLSQGQTLLEVIFVMVLITVALAAFVFTATRSVRSTANTATRSLATKYAQQGMELVRQLRDRNWSTFLSYGQTPSTRCISTDTSTSWAEGVCEVPGEYSELFTREANFSWDADAEQMTVIVNVFWEDEAGQHDTTLQSIFTRL